MARRAKMPLDSDAAAAADEEMYRLYDDEDKHPKPNALYDENGNRLVLDATAPDQQTDRDLWWELYFKHLDEEEDKSPDRRPDDPCLECEKAYLKVKVLNFEGKPVEGALVNVLTLGVATTDDTGYADYGKITPNTYKVTASKESYRPDPDERLPPVDTTEWPEAETSQEAPAGDTTVVELKLDGPYLKENIIVVGSEESYDSFWLKMMFAAPAFTMADQSIGLRPADKKTILMVDVGYTQLEKQRLQALNRKGFDLVMIGSEQDVVTYFDDRSEEKQLGRNEKIVIQDVAFFCHGLPGYLALNYAGAGSKMKIRKEEVFSIAEDAFWPGGTIYSYACRTGNSSTSEAFTGDAEAQPEKSLAQKMANHFRVDVWAFLVRTYFRDLLRDPDDSESIANTLAWKRIRYGGQVIDIPPLHEALPHDGLSDSWGALRESDYALWRNNGATKMPYGHDTPTGLTQTMQRFTPN